MTEGMADKPTDARARLMATFAIPPSEHGKGWDKLWKEGDFLPWDKGTPNPALVDLLDTRQDLIGSPLLAEGDTKRRKRALVPGCGRGYDVLLLASFGYDAVGLEISANAVQSCEEEKRANGTKYAVRDESVGAGESRFIVGDFFADEWLREVEGPGKFELIYDYTVHTPTPPIMTLEQPFVPVRSTVDGEVMPLTVGAVVPVCSPALPTSCVVTSIFPAPGAVARG